MYHEALEECCDHCSVINL